MNISPRRKLRLSLRLAMVMIVLVAIPLARLAVRARAQKEAVLAISKAGGSVGYDWQFLPDGRRKPSPKQPGQSWIQQWLGQDYFQTVEQVILQREDIGDDVMEQVGKLDGLRCINITGTRITDAGIAHLAGLSRLRTAYFQWDGHLTGACLVHLRDKKELTWLGVFTPGLRDDDLKHIEGLHQLETLLLRSPSLGDPGMTHIRGLTALKRLWIDNSTVTGRGLEQLRDLKNLERLNLPWTVDRLTPLRGLSRLRVLGAWAPPLMIRDLKASKI